MHLRKYFEKCQSSQKTILYGDDHEKKFSKTWFYVVWSVRKNVNNVKNMAHSWNVSTNCVFNKKTFFINSTLDLVEQNASQKIFRKMSVLTKNHFIWWWPREKVYEKLDFMYLECQKKRQYPQNMAHSWNVSTNFVLNKKTFFINSILDLGDQNAP